MGTHGTSLFAVVFLMRTALAAVYVGVPALLVAASVWWATRRTGRNASADLMPRARRSRLVGLGVGAVAGVVSIWWGQGELAPALVAIGYLFGVIQGELAEAPAPGGMVRTAVARPREAGRYLPRWAMWVAVAASLITVVTPVLFAVLPRVSYGPWHPPGADEGFMLPGGTLSWPSVDMTIPLAVIAVLGVLAGGLLVHRVALLPPVASDPVVDEQVRCRVARAGAGAVIGIELLVLAASAIAASGGLAVPGPAGGAYYLASRILIWTGISLAGLAVLVWCVLGSRRRVRVSPDSSPRATGA